MSRGIRNSVDRVDGFTPVSSGRRCSTGSFVVALMMVLGLCGSAPISHAAGAPDNNTVLIHGPSAYYSDWHDQAVALGFTVEVADDTAWAARVRPILPPTGRSSSPTTDAAAPSRRRTLEQPGRLQSMGTYSSSAAIPTITFHMPQERWHSYGTESHLPPTSRTRPAPTSPWVAPRPRSRFWTNSAPSPPRTSARTMCTKWLCILPLKVWAMPSFPTGDP